MSRLPSGNIVGYLPKSDRKKWRRKLRRAYQNSTYEEAKAALKGLHKELQQMNRSAARSLEEGLEQTLTLHRLGVFEEVGRSLKTTNAIENLTVWLRTTSGRSSDGTTPSSGLDGSPLASWSMFRLA
jgi:transposase-like protein